MELIPAIDIRGGKCVRLYQGDYARETTYSDDPAEVAVRWVGLGASSLHVVDLDGAKDGSPTNIDVTEKIASAVAVPIQFGGGVRTVEAAEDVLSRGVSRVIVGTSAVERPHAMAAMLERLGPDRLVVSVDARRGYVAVRGWTKGGGVQVSDLIDRMAEVGVQRFLYTDIERDGTLTEPNFRTIGDLASRSETRLIAAGGISSVQHLARLAELGVEAAVVGTALYTGDIDLREALEALNQTRYPELRLTDAEKD